MRISRKAATVGALTIAIIAAAFVAISARADTESFTLYGSFTAGWGSTSTALTNPGPTIIVTQGDTVALTLHSADGMSHNWFIDYDNNSAPSTGEPSSTDFTGSTAGFFNFTADRAGTFLYRCRFHPTQMTGVIVIRSPPTFKLYGDMVKGWGLENISASITSPGPKLTVNQGDTVTLDLTSVDGMAHSWFIDYNNNSAPDSGEPSSNSFTASLRFTFVASQAGTFVYRCRFHPSVMQGTIVVKASGAPGASTGVDTTLIIGGVVIVVAIVAVAAAVMMRRKKP